MKNSNFLIKKCDKIDNSVFDLITSVSNGKDVRNAFQEAVASLCVNSNSFYKLDAMTKAKLEAETRKEIGQYVEDIATPEWNMEIIGDVTDHLEALLRDRGIATCHPWEDDAENVCYSTRERCRYCKQRSREDDWRHTADGDMDICGSDYGLSPYDYSCYDSYAEAAEDEFYDSLQRDNLY